MPFKITCQTATDIADEQLTNKPEIRADIHVLTSVFRKVADMQKGGCDSGEFKLHLQSEITKGLSAGSRLLDSNTVSALDVAGINHLERFAVLHLSSVNGAFLRGLESVIGLVNYEAEKAAESSHRSKNALGARDEIHRALELISGTEVPFTLVVNPSLQLSSYYQEQLSSFSAIVSCLRAGWRGPSEFNKCIEIAMIDYSSWMSTDSDAAILVKSYLNYEQQQAQRHHVSDDVHGLSVALKDWLQTNYDLSDRRRERWQSYREILKELPDEKITMFDENFGVRKVFVQPIATYKVAGMQRDAEAPVSDVAGLIGTLISDRIGGDDLILLAGGPGSGKSTLCRILASELASNPDVHPVFLRLRRLQESHDIRGFIETQLQALGLIDKISDLALVPNLVFILDGFDELVMASRTKLREFFNALKEDLSTGPLRDAKAIVSGRDTLFPKGAGLPMGAHVISLQPFDKSRIAAWGAKWREQHSRDTAKSFFPEKYASAEDRRRVALAWGMRPLSMGSHTPVSSGLCCGKISQAA